MYGQNSLQCGLIIYLALLICSPISALFALSAGLVSVCTAIALGCPPKQIYEGDFCESPILTAIAIGGIFFVANSMKHLFFTLTASFFCTFIQGAILSLTSPLGLPPLNLAYHITTWAFCLAGCQLRGLTPVDITQISVAEDHIRKVKLHRKITSKFRQLNQIAGVLRVCSDSERRELELRMTPVLLCWFAYVGDI